MSEGAIKVLLVDDSAVIRGLMSQALEAYKEITIVGRASNGEQAIAQAKQLQPDVIVLDIEMPVMDGITALPELRKAAPDARIVMASTLTLRNAEIGMKALALGASDYVSKPTAKVGGEVQNFYRELVSKIYALAGKSLPVFAEAAKSEETPAPAVAKTQAAAPAKVETAAATAKAPSSPPVSPVTPLPPGGKLNPLGLHALAIATSTGGPQALMQFFGQVRGHLAHVPIYITQHMPPTFTTILAEQLSKASGMKAQEGKEGEEVQPGHVYVAPGDYHMVAERKDGKVILHVNQDAPENFCRPAADPMLRSLAQVYGSHLVVMVLTGMGQDGMEGAKEVVRKGGSVIAQNEASCVVYGMPKAVVEEELCKAVLPLPELAPFLINQIEGRR